MSAATLDARQAWRRALPLFVLVVAGIGLLYRGTAVAMASIWWRSDTFTHGFLILPIVLWLVWRQRAALAALPVRGSALGLALMAGATLLWLLGDLAAVNIATQLAFVALLALAVPAVLGWTVTRAILFPLAFLFFAVPAGEALMPRLMDWTAWFTVFALRLTGIPVYQEGLQFVIPSGNWSVVEACSGIRYLIASAMVGTLFAYLSYRSTAKRLLFIGVSILVPVAANWMRAYLIVMLGHLSGNKLAAGVDHLIYGWVFFGVVILLMFLVGARWADAPADAAASRAASVAARRGPAAGRLPVAAAAVAALALALWPVLAERALTHAEGDAAPRLAAPGGWPSGWQAAQMPPPAWKPSFQNPSAEIDAAYRKDDRNAGLYVGYYRHQGYDRKLVSSENVLVRSKDTQWAQVAGGGRAVELGGRPVAVRTAVLRSGAVDGSGGGRRLRVWQFYWVNGSLIASDTLAKIHGALHRLRGQGDDAAVVVLYAPVEAAGDPAEGDRALESFLQDNGTALLDLLARTRAQR
ncbi:MAG: exosortase A [Xylophilus ampelinus]